MSDKKNKKITVIIISILIIIILALVLTFAYLRTELRGSDEIVKVGTLDLILNETSEGITLNNAFGISDSEGINLTGSTFELKNNSSKPVDYIIYLDDNTIEETDIRIDDKYLKYNLNKNGTDTGAMLLTKIGANPNRVLDSGTIEGGETNKYSLKLWITDEVDGNYSGQVFSGKLRVEVSQERKTVAEILLADSANNIDTSDSEQYFITGNNPNNYIWYSGKLWRAVSIDTSDNSVKLVTQWNISTIAYDDDSSAFEGSYMQEWLNDTTADGFLGNLRNPESFIKMDSEWNASLMTDTSKPPSETEGGTIVISPVGLLNAYEYQTSYPSTVMPNQYFLNNWTITPSSSKALHHISSSGNLNGNWGCTSKDGVRPSINLKPEIKVVSGTGTKDNPYRLMGDNDSNLEGTKLNTRYSGEYISFGIGENKLYRIVSHETDGLTKITSSVPLKEDNVFKKISFGDTVYYSTTNIIGSFLNNNYLDSNEGYLTNEQINMIEDNTVWYLGNSSPSYKLAKYEDITGNTLTSNTTTIKVGLLRYGELMAGQFSVYTYNTGYWTLTKDSTQMLVIITDSRAYTYSLNSLYGIKPALNLKSNVIITSGDGTLQNPFKLSVQ